MAKKTIICTLAWSIPTTDGNLIYFEMMDTSQQQYLYGNYISNLHNRFVSKLEQIEAEHNFELGNEFEVAVCQILRSFLPGKYGVCRGFVVSSDGQKAGDDIIIYDQERFPTLRELKKEDFSRLENIPIEAVYVYIEAKHTLNLFKEVSKCTLPKALDQIRAVKAQLLRREKVLLNSIDPYLNISEITTQTDISNPSYRNPPMTIILSRYVAVDGIRTTNPETIETELIRRPFNPDLLCPDLIIAGSNVFAASGIKTKNGYKGQLIYEPTTESVYFSRKMKEITFGIFLARIGYAVDWIRLGKMPWADILNNVQNQASLY